MKKLILVIAVLWPWIVAAAQAPTSQSMDSAVTTDSVGSEARIAELVRELEALRASEANLRMEVEHLMADNAGDSLRRATLRHRIDSLKLVTPGVPVVVDDDTLFTIYAQQGGLRPQERAEIVSRKIERLGKAFGLEPDSVMVEPNEFEADVVYDKEIIVSITQLDALWAGQSRDSLAMDTRRIIVDELHSLKAKNSLWQIVKRVASLAAIVLALYVLMMIVGKGYRRVVAFIGKLKHTRLKPLYIQKVELLDVDKQHRLLLLLARLLRVVVNVVLVLMAVPLVFSLFPQTKSLAHQIVGYIWHPVHAILMGVANYIPNLFTIIVICVVVKYLVRFIKYFAKEIANERIHINGFFADWAMPTFYIIRFLLYAFMVAMIYPYLPGASSGVFQGISVFVGLIVSLGSSSVIGNLMAGLVITYMRPFKMGDRVEIKDMTGDVIEKTPFVTRLRTTKNEVVTIPNSFIMSAQTINYSRSAQQYGLIIHTDVTMGYDVPWRKITDTLVEAALNTPGIEAEPRPFVLQTSLGDDYTIYQLNACIRDANLLPDIYTRLHEVIQDYFNREGLELVSPRYFTRKDAKK